MTMFLCYRQPFFKSEIERLQKRIADCELKKSNGNRSLKSFLMAKEQQKTADLYGLAVFCL